MRGRTLVALLCLHALSAQAFKLETHIYVGQSVINDLEDDGRLTFLLRPGNGQPERVVTVDVPPAVRDAILAHRKEFLLGMIGPDALPDMVVGQSVPHPGLPHQWKTNDWLRYVHAQGAQSPPTRAFAYGYLGHAASDVWAHSWVNQYAGGVFDLLDNESILEERHFALEAYVALRQPRLKDRFGNTPGEYWNVVQTSDVIANFVRDQLIYAAPVQGQYQHSNAARHLVAFKAYRDGIERAAQSSIWNKIDIAVAQYFVGEYTGYRMSDEEAQLLINEVQRLNNKLNQGIDVTQSEIDSLNARLARIDKRFSTAVQNDVSRLLGVEQDFLSALQRYEQLLLQSVCEHCPTIVVPDPNPFHICGPWYRPRPCTITVVDPACLAACRSLAELTTLRNDAHTSLLTQRARLANELIGLFNDLSQARADALLVANALVDLQQVTTSGSPVQQLLLAWRADTDRAFAEYGKASAQSMINTMNPQASAFTPVQTWLDCYGPSLQGLPYVVSNCGNRQAFQRLLSTLERLSNLPTNTVAISIGLPTTTEVNAAIAAVKADTVARVSEHLAQGLIGLIPSRHQGLLQVADGPMSPELLTTAFTRSGSQHNPVLVTDIVARVDRELGLTAQGYNPRSFAPVANAIIFSKLALLDAAGIDSFVSQAGLSSSLGVSNLVMESMASIDGNHPWLEVAPPYPRTTGFEGWNWEQRPGAGPGAYPRALGFGSAAGFPLFRPGVREAVFLRLFVGPLNPGVEQAAELSDASASFASLVPPNYPYKTCRANPYPSSLQDNQGCATLQPYTPPPTCGFLGPNQSLTMYQSIRSCDGRFQLAMQGDSNLVVYQGSTPLWASHTSGTGSDLAVMQGDGNFVLYRQNDWFPFWHSQTHGFHGAYLELQDDGRLVVYQGKAPRWASTGAAPPPPPPPSDPPTCRTCYIH